MNEMERKNVFRRKFLGSGLLGAAGLSVLPGLSTAATIASSTAIQTSTLRVGFIGVGRQAMGILNGFLSLPGIEVVACSDVYGIKRERFIKRATDHYAKSNQNIEVEGYENYRDLLDRKDIDAVVIAS